MNTKNIFISCNENIYIFTRASHSWKYWCFHYTRWKYFWYSQQKSRYPLYILLNVIYVTFWVILYLLCLNGCWYFVHKDERKSALIFLITTQRAHDVNTTSPQRRCNVLTLHRRWGDVVFTSCACRETINYFSDTLIVWWIKWKKNLANNPLV